MDSEKLINSSETKKRILLQINHKYNKFQLHCCSNFPLPELFLGTASLQISTINVFEFPETVYA